MLFVPSSKANIFIKIIKIQQLMRHLIILGKITIYVCNSLMNVHVLNICICIMKQFK